MSQNLKKSTFYMKRLSFKPPDFILIFLNYMFCDIYRLPFQPFNYIPSQPQLVWFGRILTFLFPLYSLFS